MQPKTYKGKLDIGRYTRSASSGGGRGVSITLEDELSGTLVVEIDISVEAMAEALFGYSHQDCEFVLHAKNMGKIRETKTEHVPVPGGDWKHREERARDAVKPFEVDGWQAYLPDAMNHHRALSYGSHKDGFSGTVQEVMFTRYVDPPPE